MIYFCGEIIGHFFKTESLKLAFNSFIHNNRKKDPLEYQHSNWNLSSALLRQKANAQSRYQNCWPGNVGWTGNTYQQTEPWLTSTSFVLIMVNVICSAYLQSGDHCPRNFVIILSLVIKKIMKVKSWLSCFCFQNN